MAALEGLAAASPPPTLAVDRRPKVVPLRKGYIGLSKAVYQDPRICRSCVSILVGIVTFDWEGRGNGCTASMATIAAAGKVSRRTLFRHLHYLQRLDYVSVERRYQAGSARGQATPIIRVAPWVRKGELPRHVREAIRGYPHREPHFGEAVRGTQLRKRGTQIEGSDTQFQGHDTECHDDTTPAQRDTQISATAAHEVTHQVDEVKKQQLSPAAADLTERNDEGYRMLVAIGVEIRVAAHVASVRSVDQIEAALTKANKPSVLDTAGFVLHVLGYHGDLELAEVSSDVAALAERLAKERARSKEHETEREREQKKKGEREALLRRAAEAIARMPASERSALEERTRDEVGSTIKLASLRASPAFETMVQCRMRETIAARLAEG